MTGANEILERAPIAFDGSGAAVALWVEALESIRGFRFPTLRAELTEVFSRLPAVAGELFSESSLPSDLIDVSNLLARSEPMSEDSANACDDVAAELVSWGTSPFLSGSLDRSLIALSEILFLLQR
jgi:hypothetical protein